MLEQRVLNWIEEHAREKGFTDEEHTLALVGEVRRLRQLLLEEVQRYRHMQMPGVANDLESRLARE